MSQQKLEELGDLIYKIRQYAERKTDIELYVMADRANVEMRNLAAALDSEDRREAIVTAVHGDSPIVWGEALKLEYNDPLKDGRVPDIIVKPLVGVFYAGAASKKIAEHGGFYSEDVNVPLLLANPRLKAAEIKVPVPVTSVAPSILKALGLDPEHLEAVQIEKTPPLPTLY